MLVGKVAAVIEGEVIGIAYDWSVNNFDTSNRSPRHSITVGKPVFWDGRSLSWPKRQSQQKQEKFCYLRVQHCEKKFWVLGNIFEEVEIRC
jgi:hypothetical protein